MTTLQQTSARLAFRQKARDFKASARQVYAPLTLGWAETKASVGSRTGVIRDGMATAPGWVKILVYGIPLLAILALPQLPFVSAFYRTALVDRIALYVLLALGLNVVVGFAGLLDLGYVAFYAIGAYVAAYMTGVAPVQPPFVVGPFMAFPFAIVVAMLAGVLLGMPTLRLRGDYLAIVTLGFHEIVRLSLKNADGITNGDRGLRNIPHFGIPAATDANYLMLIIVLGVLVIALGALLLVRGDSTTRPTAIVVLVAGAAIAALSPVIATPARNFGQRFADFGLDPLPYYYLAVVICGLMIFIVSRLSNSRMGRAWVAIREDETAAEAMGVPTLKMKVWAFAIGASTAGFAGVILASKGGFINPQYFLLLQSIIVLAMVVFGGMGSIFGAMAGAVFIGFTQEALRDFDVVPFQPIFLVVGAVIAIGGVLVATRVVKSRAGPPYGFWLLGIGVLILVLGALGVLNIPFDRIGEEPEIWRLFILGLILTLVMILRPEGLFPSRRRAAELHGETTAQGEQLATAGADEAAHEAPPMLEKSP